MGRVLIKVSPGGGKMTIVENGQMDLETLGVVKKRVRLGRIEPCEDAPAYLEVTMTEAASKMERKLSGRYKRKADAVKAETDEGRRILKRELAAAPTQVRKSPVEVPSTGTSLGRCPLCRGVLVPVLMVVSRNKYGVVFQCTSGCKCHLTAAT